MDKLYSVNATMKRLPVCTIQRGKERIPLYYNEFVLNENGDLMHPFKLLPGDTVGTITVNSDSTMSIGIENDQPR